MQQHYKEENIQHSLITVGVPRENGQVERVNRTIIPLLTKFSTPKPEEWFKYLEAAAAQRYLNATPHRSIGTTPFELLFGTHMRTNSNPTICELIEREWIDMFPRRARSTATPS